MTVVNPPGFIQALNTHTAEVIRGVANVLTAGALSSGSLKSRAGVHPDLGGFLVVTQNGSPNMSVNVASGMALVAGTEGSKQGTYVCLNDATLNVTIAAADPSNPRIDLIVFKVQDAAYSGGTNSSSIVAVTGTPAGSPTPPAAPANSITLAQIAVAASDTSIVTGDITDKRPLLSALGAPIRCTSTTRPAASTVSEGQMIYELDTNKFYWTTDAGTTWVQIPTTDLQPLWALKTVAESVASSTTLQNDDALFVSVLANTTYKLKCHMIINTVSAASFKLDLTLPAGTTWRPGSFICGSASANLQMGPMNTAAITGITGTGVDTIVEFEAAIQVAGTAGTVQLRWAQNVSNGTSTVVGVGSWLKLDRVA